MSAEDEPERRARAQNPIGWRDPQTVRPGGARAQMPAIAGVAITELGNVLTRSGWMTEVFRNDWAGHGIEVRQLNFVMMNPQGVTDWHCHMLQNDRLVGVSGAIRLCLYDGRPASSTLGQHEVIRFGAIRPLLVTVPPGVWHALRNESGEPAAYLNVADQVYAHEAPDNWRALPSDLPDIL